jgi:tetratricopeptide (TPR) repeat protein
LLAIATAVWLALMWHGLGDWRKSETSQRVALIILGVIGLALGFGVLMTQSRAGWLAIAGALGLGVFWVVIGPLARRVNLPQWAIFWIGLGFALGVVAGIVISKPELVTTVFGNLPGPNSSMSRIVIYKQVWRLAQDTPFTGGGLAAFPGLYSTYVLSIPTLYLTHAHNSLLNLLVEQGWLGAGSYGLALALVAWFGVLRFNELGRQERAIASAGLLGLAVIIFNGLGDATLVASRVTPAILVPLGLALCGQTKFDSIWKPGRWWLVAVVLVGVGAAIFYKPLLAQWHANLGVLAQDKVALKNWPTNEWDVVSKTDQYQPAQQEFAQALAIDPDNRTALYRTGLIAMDALDFKTAADNLQRVYDVDPVQRATIKNLGYAYAWLGEYDRAKPLLSTIAESEGELQIYGWWWLNKRGRTDLAENAIVMLGRIH